MDQEFFFFFKKLINPRKGLLFILLSDQALLAEGDVEELRRMLPDKRGRAFLRAASNGLQAVLSPAVRLISSLEIRLKVKQASKTQRWWKVHLLQ